MDSKADNPHLPSFIKKTPWYAQTGESNEGESLAHQRLQEEKKPENKSSFQLRGTTGKVVTKFRKGACENCGAMTHQKRDCLERPRKMGAKYSKRDFSMDEIVQPKEEKRTFDERRDNYKSYDTDEHMVVVREKQRLLDLKELDKKKKRELKKKDKKEGSDSSSSDAYSSENSDDSDERKKLKQFSENFNDKDPRSKTHMTSLRIREHTAKYLYNLNPDSAYYNGKTRTMHDDPTKDGERVKDARFAYHGDDH